MTTSGQPQDSDPYWIDAAALCANLLSRNDTSKETIEYCLNYLGEQIPIISRLSRAVLISVYSIVIVLSLVANAAVIVIYARSRTARSVTNVFMISLAISDLFITVICLPINVWIAATQYWILGNIGCKVVPVLQFAAVSISSVTLCCIALERYSVIMHPLRSRATNTAGAVAMLVGVWLVSLICSIPCMIFYETVPLVKTLEKSVHVEWVCAWSSDNMKEKLYTDILVLVILFVVPFLTMTISYIKIAKYLLIKNKVGVLSQSGHMDNSLRPRQRAVKMLILVVTVFTLSWAPFLCYNLIGDVIQINLNELTMNLRYYLSVLAMSNTLYNPIVYIFTNEKFKVIFLSSIRRRQTSSRLLKQIAVIPFGGKGSNTKRTTLRLTSLKAERSQQSHTLTPPRF